MDAASAGVTMNWPPASATLSTSCAVSTVPPPTKQPSGAAVRTSRIASRAPGVVRAISTNRKPSSIAARAAFAAAPPSVPRTMATSRASLIPASRPLGGNAVSHVVHHSAKAPSGWRQTGPRQAWPRLSAARTTASSISMPRPGPVSRSMWPSTNFSGRLVHHVVQDFGALVVVDADALLLDQEVGRREAHLQARGQGKGAERAVRGQLDVVDLGQGGDLADLGDAAGVREVRLRHGDSGLQRGQEFLPAVEPLTRGDRRGGG